MKTKKVLIEATKLNLNTNDGTKRYVLEYLRSLSGLASKMENEYTFDIYFDHKNITNILDLKDSLLSDDHYIDKNNMRLFKLNFNVARSVVNIIRHKVIILLKYALPKPAIKVLKKIKRTLCKGIMPPDINQYDLVHLTIPQAYQTVLNCETKMVVTLYDLTHMHFPQYHVKDNIEFTQGGVDFAVDKDAEIIAISNATRDNIVSKYPSTRGRISVVYPACDHNKFKPVRSSDQIHNVRSKYNIAKGPYLLSLSVLEPRKNLVNMIKAFILLKEKHPDLDLTYVVAGKKGWMIKELFNDRNLRSKGIIFTGFIDEEDLATLYSDAVALCYVSHCEGFGLPPLEAMSCGTPVIYGNNSSMPEVIADGGLSADPNDIEDIQGKYELIFFNVLLRRRLSVRASEIAQQFSWDITAKKTLELYSRILSSEDQVRVDMTVQHN